MRYFLAVSLLLAMGYYFIAASRTASQPDLPVAARETVNVKETSLRDKLLKVEESKPKPMAYELSTVEAADIKKQAAAKKLMAHLAKIGDSFLDFADHSRVQVKKIWVRSVKIRS